MSRRRARARSAFLLAIAVAVLTGCPGPKLRQPRKVRPDRMQESCGVTAGVEISRDQALCIAGLAGMRVEPDRYTLSPDRIRGAEEVWVFEELCDEELSQCLEIMIRKSDGAIVQTRYPFVRTAPSAGS